MSRVQEKAKHERQNDDYATANTHQNSSSLNDKAHHIRRRLSQTITSRHCLLFAIALALPSAHACDDTVELQVTCDSGKTTWVVPSHITQTDNTIETNPQMVTVGSCIEGRVADIAQVKGSDIDANTNTNGIVICSQTNVCYHLNGQATIKSKRRIAMAMAIPFVITFVMVSCSRARGIRSQMIQLEKRSKTI